MHLPTNLAPVNFTRVASGFTAAGSTHGACLCSKMSRAADRIEISSERYQVSKEDAILTSIPYIPVSGTIKCSCVRPHSRIIKLSPVVHVLVVLSSRSQVFHGNTNPTDVARTMLPKPTLTRFLRVRPVAWETGIALRFEVYGCKISGQYQRKDAG